MDFKVINLMLRLKLADYFNDIYISLLVNYKNIKVESLVNRNQVIFNTVSKLQIYILLFPHQNQ